MNLARTTVRQCAFNAGQATALGIALKALLKAYPQRELLIASVEADLDELIVENVVSSDHSARTRSGGLADSSPGEFVRVDEQDPRVLSQ